MSTITSLVGFPDLSRYQEIETEISSVIHQKIRRKYNKNQRGRMERTGGATILEVVCVNRKVRYMDSMISKQPEETRNKRRIASAITGCESGLFV